MKRLAVAKCKKCGFDFREDEFMVAYKFKGDIYCEECLKPIKEITYFKLGDNDPIEPEQIEWVCLNRRYLEE